jgi:hypothetical protein
MTLLDLHLHSYLQYGMLLLNFMPVLTPEFKYSTVSFDNGIGSFFCGCQIPTKLYLWDSLPRNAMGKVRNDLENTLILRL